MAMEIKSPPVLRGKAAREFYEKAATRYFSACATKTAKAKQVRGENLLAGLFLEVE